MLAFGSLIAWSDVPFATDAWASIAEAATWIDERYPEQLPAKYGCRSWKQVVHEAPIFELHYLKMDGKRSA